MIYILQHSITKEILGVFSTKEEGEKWHEVINYSTLIGHTLKDGELIDNKYKSALENLFYAVPSQTDDKDWWPDELTKAMQEAKNIL